MLILIRIRLRHVLHRLNDHIRSLVRRISSRHQSHVPGHLHRIIRVGVDWRIVHWLQCTSPSLAIRGNAKQLLLSLIHIHSPLSIIGTVSPERRWQMGRWPGEGELWRSRSIIIHGRSRRAGLKECLMVIRLFCSSVLMLMLLQLLMTSSGVVEMELGPTNRRTRRLLLIALILISSKR